MTDIATTDQPANPLTPEEIRQELAHLSLHLRDVIRIVNTRERLARCFVGNDATIMAALLEKIAASIGTAAATLEAIDRLSLQVVQN